MVHKQRFKDPISSTCQVSVFVKNSNSSLTSVKLIKTGVVDHGNIFKFEIKFESQVFSNGIYYSITSQQAKKGTCSSESDC